MNHAIILPSHLIPRHSIGIGAVRHFEAGDVQDIQISQVGLININILLNVHVIVGLAHLRTGVPVTRYFHF